MPTKKTSKAAPKKTEEKVISIPKLKPDILILDLVGDSELVSHRWSKKAKQQMLDKQMGKAKGAKEPKDPIDDYAESLYIINEKDGDREKVKAGKFKGLKFGMPSTAFKNAAVNACRQVDGIAMVAATGAFHVNLGEELVEIIGTPELREDMVRIDKGKTSDIRYRGTFKKWRARIRVSCNPNVLSPEQITNLFNIAGFSVGIGESRPEKRGSWGMFHVATQADEIS